MKYQPITTLLIAALLAQAFPALAACTVADIEIKSMRAKFVDRCRTRSCAHMQGIAVLRNNCATAVGVQVKITGYDAKNQPVATRELWPASVRNIPPGDFEFSLDTWLDPDPTMRSFALTVVEVKRWRD